MRVFVLHRRDDPGAIIAFPESKIETIKVQSGEESRLFKVNDFEIEGDFNKFVSELRNPCGPPEGATPKAS